MTKQFWVDIIRREESFERYCVLVSGDSAEDAQRRVREHYMDGAGTLSQDEEHTELHSKSLGVEGSEVIDIGEAEEART
jgi:NH3-dependent NAD+ synthetase